jgi:hypothetical protein
LRRSRPKDERAVVGSGREKTALTLGPMRRFVVVMALSACAASVSRGDVPDEEAPGAARDDEAPESDRERLVRLATEKREQCQSLGYAIETAESGGQEFVNLNDERALTRLARARTQTATRVAAMKLTSEPLLPVRDDYVALTRGMADALSATATTTNDKDKKASLARYRELEKEVEAIIERFNGACDGR